jgi:hypothetical protein
MAEEQLGFLTMEAAWVPKTCPVCNREMVTAHGWLFKDAPPKPPLPDQRKAVSEVFMHDDSEDCILHPQE